MKAIKASVSNLLALLTKVSDAIFVYGYSTVYLLFAYFKEDFTSSAYIFSGVNYTILLALIAAFTLALGLAVFALALPVLLTLLLAGLLTLLLASLLTLLRAAWV